jgi:transcription-repair coupling factor (superfamily II helicase)
VSAWLLGADSGPEAFANALTQLLGDPVRAARLGRGARAVLDAEHAWPVLAARTLRLLEALGARARPRDGRGGASLAARDPAAPPLPGWGERGVCVCGGIVSEASLRAAPVQSLADVVARVVARQGRVRLTGLSGSARAVVGAELVREHGDRPVLFVTPSSKRADVLLEDLKSALGAGARERLRLYPRHDTPPYDRFSPQPFVIAQRMDVLYRWLASGSTPGVGAVAGEPTPVVVTPVTALAARVPSRSAVRACTTHLEVGQTLDRDRLVEMLVSAGYARMPIVEDCGEISVRGGILDIFPPQRARPIRVELLGDEVESIREFDPASQRSQGVVAHAIAAPPRELLFDRKLAVERAPAIHALAEAQGADGGEVDRLVDALLRGHIPPGAEALAPLLQPQLETVFDYLAPDALVVIDDPTRGRERSEQYAEDAFHSFAAALEARRLAAPVDALFLAPDAIAEALETRRPVLLERLDVEDAGAGERYAIRAYPHDELVRELRTRW